MQDEAMAHIDQAGMHTRQTTGSGIQVKLLIERRYREDGETDAAKMTMQSFPYVVSRLQSLSPAPCRDRQQVRERISHAL